ncbi:GAP family protein [Patescibacteria group bacterium]|nr:GAP family protein [Patescibacteria group bacterium]
MSFIALSTSAVGIGLIDSSDPIAYALIFRILATKRPIRNFLYFLLPYFILVFLLGNVFFFLGQSLVESLKSSFAQGQSIFFLALGGILICIGVLQFFLSEKKKKKQWNVKLEGIYCSLSALILFLINAPLFILYAGLVLTIIQSGVAFPLSIVFILIYSITLIMPYILVAILYKKYETTIRKILDKVFTFLGNKYVFGSLLILIGLYLVFG